MSAKYDWDTFKRYHGGINGARFCFEDLMEELLRKENPDRNVKSIKLAQGDGGIDVFIGNIGVEKIDVYQCKYFDGGLKRSQWKQITDSYNRALKNPKYEMKKWILCIPMELSLDENIEWQNWIEQHKVESIEIKLICGNEIIDRLQESGLCEKYFRNMLPKYISNRPTDIGNYIYRYNEVKKLSDELELNKNILIYGEGGYGKTSLAIMLFDSIKEKYSHLAWVNYENCLIDSLLDSLTIYEGIKREERIELICNFFRQQNKKTIVFIDNVNESIQDDEYIDELAGCVSLVITSRVPFIENFKKYHIEIESIDECKKIFEMYYEKECNIEDNLFKSLMGYLEKNLLMIELIAKTARYAETSLTNYIKEILSKGFGSSNDIVYSKYDSKQDSLINRLKQLYTLQNMTVEEQEILRKFVLTPNLYVPFKYREWAGIEKSKMIDLINRGWINKSEEGYKMHPLIKESIVQQEELTIDLFEKLINNFSDNDFWQLSEGYNYILIKKQIAKKIIDYFIKTNYKQLMEAILNYHQICRELSDYKEAISVLKRICELYKQEQNRNEKILWQIYLSLAYSYFDSCEEKTSREYLNLVDEMMDTSQFNDDELFNVYNLHIMVACFYGEMEDARKYFNEVCKLELTEFDFLTTVSNYISGLIQANKIESAMKHMNKYKDRIEKEFSDKESYLATFYSNLAIVYARKSNFSQALFYDQKAYEIRKRIFGTYSRDVAITYISLAEDYMYFNKNEAARDCVIKAEEICDIIFENKDNKLYQSVLHAKYVLGIC